MKRFKLFLLFLTWLPAYGLLAQNFEVPKGYKFEKAEDYASYEKDVIACVNWLERSPIRYEQERRVEANRFFVLWIQGSPTVSIELGKMAIDLAGKNKDMLVLFMGGYTRFVLENPEKSNDKLAANIAALKCVIKFYELNLDKGVVKDKNIEKIISMDKKGKLSDWVAKQI